MSKNRKRRQRRQAREFEVIHITRTTKRPPKKRRGIPHEIMALVQERRDRYNKGRQEQRDGSGEAQPPKPQRSKLWRHSTVDKRPHIHGTRHRTRSVDARWGGSYLTVTRLTRQDMLAGVGLDDSGRYGVTIDGALVGRTSDPQHGLGYARAVKQVFPEYDARMVDYEAS